jgi:hypothetical protein
MPDTARDRFVTRPLLGAAALIFLVNAPTLTVFGTPTAKIGGAILYLAVALVIASLAKALLVVVRHGSGALTA